MSTSRVRYSDLRAMPTTKAMKIAALAVAGFGLLFAVIGAIVFFALVAPETRAMRIASDESLPTYMAQYTDYIRTNTTVNGEQMYRLRFAWGNNTAQTSASFSHAEARARVGQNVEIRVSEAGRAVPADFARGVRSTVGYILLGVFGGVGLVSGIVAAAVFAAARKRERLSAPPEEEKGFYSR